MAAIRIGNGATREATETAESDAESTGSVVHAAFKSTTAYACDACGTEIDEGAVFCHSCGARVTKPADLADVDVVGAVTTADETSAIDAASRRRLAIDLPSRRWLVAAAVVVVVASIAGFLYVRQGGDG